MAVQVKVSGVDILLKDLDQYSKDVKQGVLDEIREWSVRTEADAQRDVPVKTGDLKGTIRTASENNGLTWIVKAGGIDDVNYAPFIEFGTGVNYYNKHDKTKGFSTDLLSSVSVFSNLFRDCGDCYLGE